MKKRILLLLNTLFSFTFLSFLASFSVGAYTINPNTGTILSNTESTISVVSASTVHNSVEVKLTFTNMEVVSFTPSSGITSVGTCSGGTTFVASSICVTLSSTTNFTASQVLGAIKVKATNTGTGTITVGTGAKYTAGTAELAVTAGTSLGSFTTSNTTNVSGELPKTAFWNEGVDTNLFLAILLFALAFGITALLVLDKYFFLRVVSPLFQKNQKPQSKNWVEENV